MRYPRAAFCCFPGHARIATDTQFGQVEAGIASRPCPKSVMLQTQMLGRHVQRLVRAQRSARTSADES